MQPRIDVEAVGFAQHYALIALRQIRSIRQCVSRQVMLSMVVSLVLQRLDFGNATLIGLPAYQLSRLQCVLNAAALVLSRSKYDHVTPLLQGLHWLRIEQGIEFKLLVLVFRCLNGLAPSYLSRDLLHASDLAARQCCIRRQRRRSSFRRHAFPPLVTALSPWLRCGHGTACQDLSHRYLHWRPLDVS